MIYQERPTVCVDYATIGQNTMGVVSQSYSVVFFPPLILFDLF